jgi:hypothetical protein
MKRILLIIGLFAFLTVPVMAENLFSSIISTTNATVCAGPISVDWFHIYNSSNAIANIIIYDGAVEKLKLSCPALADRSYPIPSKIKFNTSVTATGYDEYSNQKVKLYLNQW